MKLSKRTLLKLKNKNKKLKPNKYKKLKREGLRGRIKGTLERPRLSVYRSNEHIFAQIIDDANSLTLLACLTLDLFINFNFKCDFYVKQFTYYHYDIFHLVFGELESSILLYGDLFTLQLAFWLCLEDTGLGITFFILFGYLFYEQA